MAFLDLLYSYITYLIHPFKSHKFLMGESVELKGNVKKLSLYEAIGASWIFIVINGFFRILLINFTLIMFFEFTELGDGLIGQLIHNKNYSGFYFLILSTVLDVVFFPVLTLIIVHFWEFIIKVYGRFLGIESDLDQKARDILTVSLSSNIFMVIPIFGDFCQKLASIFLMFTGIRQQFGTTTALSLCILMTPFLMFTAFFSVLLLGMMLAMA